MSAEEALEALARDLVEEIAAARAVELASQQDTLELVAPLMRKVKKLPALTGHEGWVRRGERLWGGQRFHDIDQRASVDFGKHVESAYGHLADPEKPRLANGYESLHEAHRVAAERLLPRAETDQQKKSVRDAMAHITKRMRDIDKAAAVKSTRTRRLTGSVPERSKRAQEAIEAQQEEVFPQVQVPPVKLPPPLKGASAVHPHLAYKHVTVLAGDTLSGIAHRHVPQPFPAPAPTEETTALNQANGRLDQYAKREENARQADLRDHLQELRQGEAERRRQLKEKEQREAERAKQRSQG